MSTFYTLFVWTRSDMLLFWYQYAAGGDLCDWLSKVLSSLFLGFSSFDPIIMLFDIRTQSSSKLIRLVYREPKWRLKQVRKYVLCLLIRLIYEASMLRAAHTESYEPDQYYNKSISKYTNFEQTEKSVCSLNWLTEIFKTRFICFKGISHFECSNVRRYGNAWANHNSDNGKQSKWQQWWWFLSSTKYDF